ncbi:hypothetical protein F2P81_014387 [Scophthalmus maximus]|uniref:Uncharacterized protein n=1 Tax=Scophthalmus maximus TaxID=52904 RepID=A0A6A4STF9_SCOMX|nr:hypothetical protein F2P81_014387 [Scophthalmus maximus]
MSPRVVGQEAPSTPSRDESVRRRRRRKKKKKKEEEEEEEEEEETKVLRRTDVSLLHFPVCFLRSSPCVDHLSKNKFTEFRLDGYLTNKLYEKQVETTGFRENISENKSVQSAL